MVQEAPSSELTEDEMKLAEPLVPVFGIELLKPIFLGGTDWHLKE